MLIPPPQIWAYQAYRRANSETDVENCIPFTFNLYAYIHSTTPLTIVLCKSIGCKMQANADRKHASLILADHHTMESLLKLYIDMTVCIRPHCYSKHSSLNEYTIISSMLLFEFQLLEVWFYWCGSEFSI
jgi:hypothetical protein